MKRRHLLILAILSGLLLTPAWFEWGHGLILMIALVPLLFIEDHLTLHARENKSVAAFLYAYLTFFIFNAVTTWWIYNATIPGAVFAILANTLLSSLVFWAFHFTKRKLGSALGYFALIVYWITWEHFYFNAEISWPWLVLGHGFNYNIKLIQWYEYTGVLGGSLWILTVNILIFNSIKMYTSGTRGKALLAPVVLILLLIISPVAVSLIRFNTYVEKTNPVKIVVIQPNIDPYAKFVSMPSIEQTTIQLNEAASMADSTVDYFVAPETSINSNIWMDKIESVPDIRLIRRFLSNYPGAKYVVGVQCYRRFWPGEELTANAHLFPGGDFYYDSYNAAIQLDSTPNVPFYFKSQLVVGVEKMPYTRYLKFLEKFMIRLGGTFRGWGTQEDRGTFVSGPDSIRIAPVICYESVFGEFVTGYIKNGANLIFVITNDGWWGNTPGHHQHNAFSSIRAIETRRSVARSANTGISCFINQRGEMMQKLTWWKRGALKDTLNANDRLTFYVRYGDYIGRTARFFSLLVILWLIVNLLMNVRKKKA
ncbi:MAG: apolipoprotein N-acyltransferase [Bacteroidales bacterium]|nr:apolipoprotein N-acyltransferase [Bacteroidales bacterium]